MSCLQIVALKKDTTRQISPRRWRGKAEKNTESGGETGERKKRRMIQERTLSYHTDDIGNFLICRATISFFRQKMVFKRSHG